MRDKTNTAGYLQAGTVLVEFILPQLLSLVDLWSDLGGGRRGWLERLLVLVRGGGWLWLFLGRLLLRLDDFVCGGRVVVVVVVR